MHRDRFLLELSVAHVLALLVWSELSGVSEEAASMAPLLDFSMAASEVLKVDPKLQTLLTYRKLALVSTKLLLPLAVAYPGERLVLVHVMDVVMALLHFRARLQGSSYECWIDVLMLCHSNRVILRFPQDVVQLRPPSLREV